MAVVTAISPGCVQTNDHLVPPSVLAQMLRQACQVAFGQPLELLHHLLSLVHCVKALDLKEHVAKRLVFGVDESFVFHDNDEQATNVRQ